MKDYDTAEYARSRLVETVIRLGNIPVTVYNCTKSGPQIIIHYREIHDDKEIHQAPLEMFNLDPVPLGYVNHGKEAIYISRMPMRKDWRQGLRHLNMVDVKGCNIYNIPMRVIVNTILGSFPSFTSTIEALNKTSKSIKSQAYCRDFSIGQTGDLRYKGLFIIGSVDMSNGNTNVDANYNWVREALEESLT